jgi:NADH-quinone oxidoreductase subunit I
MSTYFRDIKDSIWTVLVGMRITWRHMFMKKVTIQYPTVKRDLPDRVRNRLYVNMDDCIGCDQCAKACPVNCIKIETIKALASEDLGSTSTGNKKRLWVPTFDIDIAKCCYCGLCVYPCPTECIKMTDVFEFSEYNRNDLVYRFSLMTPEEVAAKRAAAEAYQREQDAKKAAAAAAAAEAKKKEAEAAAAAKKAE